MKYQVACSWTMVGEFEVEASSQKEAIELVKAGKVPYDSVPENSEILADSFQVDEAFTNDINFPERFELN